MGGKVAGGIWGFPDLLTRSKEVVEYMVNRQGIDGRSRRRPGQPSSEFVYPAGKRVHV